ncbi:MAG: A/G-specific adenine glycosylase [Pseudomonadota bacterium]
MTKPLPALTHRTVKPLDGSAGRALLGWYDRHQRAMPWRQARPDPYRVWLSEVMLQQTTVAAVVPYFERFLARWPTVEALAAADDAAVMEAWAGLGYYARARNLLACAREVAARGGFPRSSAGLRALPGVGVYTSAAVAAIAFGEAVSVVDGNVERVVARLLRLQDPPKTVAQTVHDAVRAMLPADRPGDFAQAMMDLGATICTPRKPVCGFCVLSDHCAASAVGDPLDFPKKVPKKPRKEWHGAVFAPFRADGSCLFRQRPPKGLLGGMPELFGSPWGAPPENPFRHAPFRAKWVEAGSITHGFTHAELTLRVFRADAPARARPPSGAYWRRPDEAGLPTLMKKAVARAA